MILICISYILISHLIHIFGSFKNIIFEYHVYIYTSRDNLKKFIWKLIFGYKHYYFAAIFEELLFRLPICFYPNNEFLLYFFVSIFGLQHFDSKLKWKTNIIKIIHTSILGLFFSLITIEYKTIYFSIVLHIFNNFLTAIEIFGFDYKKKNPRKVLDFIQYSNN